MRQAADTLLLAALVCVCAALIYLDWRRQGEVALLNERVESFERRLRASDDRLRPVERTRSTVERILHASDDRTLADIARGNA